MAEKTRNLSKKTDGNNNAGTAKMAEPLAASVNEMQKYKADFISLLLRTGALKFGRDYTLKSKRQSPYFLNAGGLNDGESIKLLGQAYASAIIASNAKFDLLFGPAYKGIPLVITTSIALANNSMNVGWAFDRKEVKDHGEATGASLQDKVLVGSRIKDGSRIVLLDDVITTGGAKYEAIELLSKMAKDLKYPALIIAADRQEVGIDGTNAIQKLTGSTGMPVFSIITASDIIQYLKAIGGYGTDVLRMENYVRCYGAEAARKGLPALGQTIIQRDRSVIPACDVETIEQFEELVKQTADIVGIGGYKIGFELGYGYGLPKVVETARKYTQKPLIFDHQKAGSDIPDTGKNFARVCKKAGIDTVIMFPQAGPETERAWIYHALNQGLKVIVGGRMTHPAYAQSEGGFISDEGALEMYRIAARAGIGNFVVPGNKPDVIKMVREIVKAEGVAPVFYAPGFIAQGGKIEDAAKAAGDKFHGIVGRGIYEASDMKAAAAEHTSQL